MAGAAMGQLASVVPPAMALRANIEVDKMYSVILAAAWNLLLEARPLKQPVGWTGLPVLAFLTFVASAKQVAETGGRGKGRIWCSARRIEVVPSRKSSGQRRIWAHSEGIMVSVIRVERNFPIPRCQGILAAVCKAPGFLLASSSIFPRLFIPQVIHVYSSSSRFKTQGLLYLARSLTYSRMWSKFFPAYGSSPHSQARRTQRQIV